ncbi:MAG: ribosome-associated translation inhibitor RaiA [Eubacteriales bacterium]|nr:ribosome-associated translation inhibitor RaiA [Eubacteriales bacterium]
MLYGKGSRPTTHRPGEITYGGDNPFSKSRSEFTKGRKQFMKITFVGKKLELRQSTKSWAEKKLSKLDKYFEDDADIKLVIGKIRDKFTIECTVLARGTIFRVEETEDDLFLAIDHIVPAIERQIRKNKTRLSKRLRSGAEMAPTETDDIFKEEKEFNIVRIKAIPKKPMSPEEAILQMNLLGHNFFIFENSDLSDVSLVYKRKDGDYGLIEFQ